MRHREFGVVSAVGLMLAMAHWSPLAANEIVNGGFETGNFSGWALQRHSANAPGGGSMMTGGQVLTGDDFFADGSVQPGILPPGGNYFAFISSMPSIPADQPPGCPTTQSVLRVPPDNVDGDAFSERDVTVLRQDIVVDSVPAHVGFTWSFLRGEFGDIALHDDFYVTLTRMSPPGPTIQVMGDTAGNDSYPIPYIGSFRFLDPSLFDGHTYEVLTDPPGGPTDCHYSSFGRTSFQTSSAAIPTVGTWRLSFFFGDDGGDARWDSGVLIDDVRFVSVAAAPALSATGRVAVVLLLGTVALFGLAAQSKRERLRGAGLLLGVVCLVGAGVVLLRSQPAVGSAPVGEELRSRTGDEHADEMLLADRRTPRKPTPAKTRKPKKTQTPIVS
ncbi:MAG: hypothetical protein HY699_02020 [Deltaproteobacteria bacterium]|nr:hypothetical protein [Deltaproteobacteria bacterium]